MTMTDRTLFNLGRLIVWLAVGLCCVVPVGWLAIYLLAEPSAWAAIVPDGFRSKLIGKTLLLNAAAATLATVVAVGPAVVMGLSRRAAIYALVVPLPLVLPTLVLSYGWSQACVLIGLEPRPQSFLDVTRCVVALASWLWPVPAIVAAFFLRRVDPALLLLARVDGAWWRIVLRLLVGPLLVGWAIAMTLAMQEFAIFEPTGISVIATEARAVFETGMSLHQSVAVGQPSRVAAAVGVLAPAVVVSMILSGVAAIAARRILSDFNATDDRRPSIVRPGTACHLLSIGAILLAVVVPIAALISSHRGSFDLARVLNAHGPELLGSLRLALWAGLVGTAVAVGSQWAPPRGLLVVAVVCFLAGGQWIAIALITLWNRLGWAWVAESDVLPTLAYGSRFLWIALAAGVASRGAGLRWLTDQASVDGAGRWQTWRGVVFPFAWPAILAAALLIVALASTEVPATTLLSPGGTLVPMLMTWAHTLRYDPMIEASLLLVGVALFVGLVSLCVLRLRRSGW
jgi:ABC-type Fe3+ transport system permease subunit